MASVRLSHKTRPQSISGARATQIRVDLQTSHPGLGRIDTTVFPLHGGPAPPPGLLIVSGHCLQTSIFLA